MRNVYTEAMVNEIVARLSKKYVELLVETRKRIKELSAENERLREELAKSEEVAAAEADTAEKLFDLEKVLRPDGNLKLENLCKELGLMDDND